MTRFRLVRYLWWYFCLNRTQDLGSMLFFWELNWKNMRMAMMCGKGRRYQSLVFFIFPPLNVKGAPDSNIPMSLGNSNARLLPILFGKPPLILRKSINIFLSAFIFSIDTNWKLKPTNLEFPPRKCFKGDLF